MDCHDTDQLTPQFPCQVRAQAQRIFLHLSQPSESEPAVDPVQDAAKRALMKIQSEMK